MSALSNDILFKKFEILSCYKKDEHSAVYLANHIYLEKKVFLKVLNTETIPDSTITERFKREAKILAQLEHPNIIKVFDFGMFKEYFYISFEYFESKNLREFLGISELSERIKREIFIQLVKGLNLVHQKKVVHRDIKPENILVNDNNEVKLTDFGLAQESLKNLVTQKYSVVGTPAYMSPEQIQGEQLTIKSDLFSLGIVAFEIFSGKNPFLGKDPNETINNIISYDEKNHEQHFDDFSDDIQKVIKGLLAADPYNRLNSCSEIFNILQIEVKKVRNISEISNKKLWLAIIVVIAVIATIWIGKSVLLSNEPNLITDEQPPVNIGIDTESFLKDIDSVQITNNEQDEDLTSKEKMEVVPETKIHANFSRVSENANIKTEIGELYIKCYPWAKVYLNNKYIETTPLTENITTNTGNYLLTLTHPDYPKYSDSIMILTNELKFIEVNLDTLFGYFDCKVFPWGEVYIDEKKKGLTPLQYPIKLDEGKYRLKLINPQYENIETTIDIMRNDTLRMKFNMKNKK